MKAFDLWGRGTGRRVRGKGKYINVGLFWREGGGFGAEKGGS